MTALVTAVLVMVAGLFHLEDHAQEGASSVSGEGGNLA